MRYMRILFIIVALLLAACGATDAPPATTAVPTAADAAPASTPAPAAEPTAVAPPADAPAPTAAASQPEATAPAVAASTGPITLELQPVASGFDNPLYLTSAGDGSDRVFVVEKAGRIVIMRDGAPVTPPFLDITDRVGSQANEQGLLSVAFHPRYAENGLLFVNYTDQRGNTVIARYTAAGDAADATSERILLTIEQPYPNHNGGLSTFGPDGYLYIGTGDGGNGGDPQGFGQNLDALLGKMLRIDVDSGDPYGIPADNPWIGGGARPEIWAVGLRNPWRFSFDRASGDLYIGDVGQNRIEEIHYTPAGAAGGVNYGWNIIEGSSCFRGNCDTTGLDLPVAEYDHQLGCSVTGGYVYRGAAFPQMQGAYIFGDFCSGLIWALRGDGAVRQMETLLDTDMNISSFGEDDAGELYLTSMYEGVIYQLVAGE